MDKQSPTGKEISLTTAPPSTLEAASTPAEILLHYASANRLLKVQEFLHQHPLLDIINISDTRMYTRTI